MADLDRLAHRRDLRVGGPQSPVRGSRSSGEAVCALGECVDALHRPRLPCSLDFGRAAPGVVDLDVDVVPGRAQRARRLGDPRGLRSLVSGLGEIPAAEPRAPAPGGGLEDGVGPVATLGPVDEGSLGVAVCDGEHCLGLLLVC